VLIVVEYIIAFYGGFVVGRESINWWVYFRLE